jgi:hypothetical protein
MSESDNITSLAKELSSGNSLMAFKPDDVEQKFFIGETIIIAAATVFGTAFLKGINSALEKRGEELGKVVTDWVVNKIEGLFRKPKDAKNVEDESKKESIELGKSASKLDEKTVTTRMDIIEKQIEAKLVEQGVSPKQAKNIAKKSRLVAESQLSKAIKNGTK